MNIEESTGVQLSERRNTMSKLPKKPSQKKPDAKWTFILLNLLQIANTLLSYFSSETIDTFQPKIILGISLGINVLFILVYLGLAVSHRRKHRCTLNYERIIKLSIGLSNLVAFTEIRLVQLTWPGIGTRVDLHLLLSLFLLLALQFLILEENNLTISCMILEIVYLSCRILINEFAWDQLLSAVIVVGSFGVLWPIFRPNSVLKSEPMIQKASRGLELISMSPNAVVVLDSTLMPVFKSRKFDLDYGLNFQKTLSSLRVNKLYSHNHYSSKHSLPAHFDDLLGDKPPTTMSHESSNRQPEDSSTDRSASKNFLLTKPPKKTLKSDFFFIYFADCNYALGQFSMSKFLKTQQVVTGSFETEAIPVTYERKKRYTTHTHHLPSTKKSHSYQEGLDPRDSAFILRTFLEKIFNDEIKVSPTRPLQVVSEETSRKALEFPFPLDLHIQKVELDSGAPGIVLFIQENLRTELQCLVTKNEEFKSLLLASVSHELRTPLNGTIGLLQGAESLKESNSMVYHDIILPARNSAFLLYYVINDLIDFSMLNAGHFDFDITRFSVHEAIKEIIPIIEHQTSLKKLAFSLEIDESLNQICSDANRINQILLNLVMNSIKFTSTGKITISIDQDPEHWDRTIYSVSDTGVGLNPTERKALVEMLRNLGNNSTKLSENSVGVGLGLTISQLLAKRLGPEDSKGLKVVSAQDQGTKISFAVQTKKPSGGQHSILNPQRAVYYGTRKTIFNVAGLEKHQTSKHLSRHVTKKLTFKSITSIPPEGRVEELPKFTFGPQLTQKTEPVPDIETTDCRCPQVLIVDDNDYNQIALGKMIEALGVRYQTAYNGELAIQAVEAAEKARMNCLICNNFSLIMMDCNMPVMDGYKATRILKEKMRDGEITEIPIIACTSFCKENEILKCEESGMDGFLSKPVFISKLSELFKQYCII